MDDHDLLVRIDERVSVLPEIKAKLDDHDHRLDCMDRRVTRNESYLKIIGTAITVAAASIVKLFLGK